MQNDKIYALLIGEILLKIPLVISVALENSCDERAVFLNMDQSLLFLSSVYEYKDKYRLLFFSGVILSSHL